jgi:hypothetical protein
VQLTDLRALDVSGLERLYKHAPDGEVPTGRWRGVFLVELPGVPLVYRAIDHLMFDLTPFGIDFDRRVWFFFRQPRLAAGHFRTEPGRSRWRDTGAIALHYDPSRLPGPVRGILYDEVKPLGPELCLGIGGVNREAPEGPHFFFALVPA